MLVALFTLAGIEQSQSQVPAALHAWKGDFSWRYIAVALVMEILRSGGTRRTIKVILPSTCMHTITRGAQYASLSCVGYSGPGSQVDLVYDFRSNLSIS